MQGLPLAIVTVAGALKGKATPSWEAALKQLQDAGPRNISGMDIEVYKHLKLSYDFLESHKVRYLFLLCSLFQEDSDIWTGELLRYGVGLHIFSKTAKDMKHARDMVCLLLETLRDSFLLSQGSDKDYVKMHDVVRDVAIDIASEGDHIFMVSHHVTSKEFPRKDSYKQYSHLSIVASEFDELHKPISCPRLKLLVLKLCFEDGFKLQDDFFDGMSGLNVLSLSGYDRNSILPFPSSIQRLSNLRTLYLSNLRLDDISIIGELVTLEILSIRDSYLEELPVEIRNLTNLIVLYWNPWWSGRMRISPGVLSKLVRLEELHMLEVEDCSYSTLRELESLSRLTALTFDECSVDVIYSNLGLSSKLTRYALKVGGGFLYTSIMKPYNKIIALDVTESTQLGDWIRLLLRNSEFVSSREKGSKNVLVELQNVKDLRLADCDLLNFHCLNNILFTRLERLELDNLRCFTHFCSDTVEGIAFPLLRAMHFRRSPEFQNFWPTDNNAITDLNPLFNEKVSCPNLEELKLNDANSISALCSHQLPIAYFSKLVTLEVRYCEKLRNLMSPSVVRGLLNLRTLWILEYQSMEEVIAEEEEQGDEIMCNDPLFPVLEELKLYNLPKLGHFILTKHAIGFPFLKEVDIRECPKMKTFIQQGNVSTLNLERVKNDDELKIVDLNKAMFNSKVSCPNLEKLELEEANSITALWSHQLPTAYFSKLVTLKVENCGKLRNLMSPYQWPEVF
ncbi:hypothetical protein P3S68_029249 [Capsicum galapagoense]